MQDSQKTYAIITASRFSLAQNLAAHLEKSGISSYLLDTMPLLALKPPPSTDYSQSLDIEHLPQIASQISYAFYLDEALLHTIPAKNQLTFVTEINRFASDANHFANFYNWNCTAVTSALANMHFASIYPIPAHANFRKVLIHEHLAPDELTVAQIKTPLNQFMTAASKHHLPQLASNYLISPISTTDAVNAIVKAAFMPNLRGKILYCAQKNPLDLNSLSQELSQYQGFKKTHKVIHSVTSPYIPREKIIATKKLLNWQPQNTNQTCKDYLEKNAHIQLTLKKTNKSIHQPSIEYPKIFRSLTVLRMLVTSDNVKYKLPHIARTSLRYSSIALGTLAIITGIYCSLVARTYYSLYQSTQYLKSAKFEQAKVQAQFAQKQFPQYRQHIGLLPHSLQQSSWIQVLDSNYKLAHDTSKLIVSGTDLAQSSHMVLNGFTENSSSQLATLEQLNRVAPKFQQELTLYLASLPQSLPTPISSIVSQSQYESGKNSLNLLRDYLSDYLKIKDVLPDALGMSQPQKYVVLFQNNYELRPTGGFIGSFAIMTIDKGTIASLDVHDVYDADGQLRGYVPAPQAIQEHLGEPAWYLRDANWDPDFPTSVQDIRWFLDKEINLQANGFIAVNLSAVQSLLQVLGPIKIDNLDEPLTAHNIHELLQNHIESDFFPGSQRKRSSLSQLANSMIDKAKILPSSQIQTLFSTISQNLAQKQVLLNFDEPKLQQLASLRRWTGQISPVLGVSNDIISDTFFVVDANVGVNKANQFVTVSNHQQVKITADSTQISLTRTYHNASSKEDKQQGTYKTYLRVYLPPDAEFINATTQIGASQATTILEPENEGQHHGYAVYGFPIKVLPGQKITLAYTYLLPQTLQENLNNTAYQMQIIKQSGTNPDPFELQIQYPHESFTPQVVITESQTNDPLTKSHQLTYNTDLATDRFIRINFKKNN